MIKYFMNKYAFSREGAKRIILSIVWQAIKNILAFLPLMLTFYFLQNRIKELQFQSTVRKSIWFYIIIAIVMFTIMLLVEIRAYTRSYGDIYLESAKVRIGLAEKLRKLPLSFFGKRDIADLSSTIMQDATEMESLFSHAVPQMYGSVVSITIMSILLCIFEIKLALSLLWVIPIALIGIFLSRNYSRKKVEEVTFEQRKVSSKLQEGLDSIQEIKAYNYETQYSEYINESLDEYERKLVKSEIVISSIINSLYIVLKLGIISVTVYGAYLFAAGKVELFEYVAFLIMSAFIFNPVMQLLNHLAALNVLNQRVDRIKKINSYENQTGKPDMNCEGYDIKFENVEFSYSGIENTIDNISFTAKQGQVTALVGPSGGGKSTVAKLAARFWDINSGKITVGGEDISKIDPEVLLQNYSIVFQDVTLFNQRIMDNIRIGKKQATDEEILKAAKLAECDEFVEKLPDGYNTIIGENGARLSGGERQRISIARAILKNAPIILLDEASSSLDVENESKIQTALATLIQKKTVIIIAHRMRTVLGADNIIVLKDGKIVQEGKADKLLQEEGLFKTMNK